MKKLYQADIKAHSFSPIGLDKAIDETHFSEGYNASCGDEIDISLKLNASSKIDDISFKHDSCAICTASASILCDVSITFNKDRMNEIYLELLSILNHNNDQPDKLPNEHLPNHKLLTELSHSLSILAPVSAYPSRVNCALLPWQTALAAFDKPLIVATLTEAVVDNA